MFLTEGAASAQSRGRKKLMVFRNRVEASVGEQRRGRISGERRSRAMSRPARGSLVGVCVGVSLECFSWRRELAACCDLQPRLLVRMQNGMTFLESKLA